MQNPYKSPSNAKFTADLNPRQTDLEVSQQGCGSEIAWLLIPPIVCTVGGFAWYVLAITLAEYFFDPSANQPGFEYGGPAIFLCLSLSTFYGLLTGLAACVFGSRQRKWGGFSLMIVACVTAVISSYWWLQFETEGSAKYVLFLPLFIASLFVGFIGLFFSFRLNHNTAC
jgi:hypothetical protein